MELLMEIFTQVKDTNENPNKYNYKASSKRKHIQKPVRILIVEDEITSREALASILRDCNYEVDTAVDGDDAIEKAKKTSFDIAIIDVVLGELNGVETFKIIKKINPHVVTIMMTAYLVDDLVKDALGNGAHSCIYKPFDIEEVVNLIKKICNQKLH